MVIFWPRLVGLVTAFLGVALGFTGTLYTAVVSTFPSDLEDECFLWSAKVPNRVACASLCSQRNDCHLFCYDGTTCRLYSAWVTRYWTGIAGDVPKTRCYSSWEDKKNIAANVTIVASRSFRDSYHKTNGNNGYHCFRDADCYLSTQTTYPYWSANLGYPRAISAVKLITRRLSAASIYLSNAEVRVGNSTTSFSTNNLLLGKLGASLTHRTVYTITAETPITGKVVSVQKIDSSFLMFCEIQIIEA